MQLTAANLDLETASKNYQIALRNSIALGGAGALLAVLLAWFIIRGAMRKLGADPGEAAQVARRVASGDLQFELEAGHNDDVSLMGALRQMKDSLLHSKLDYEGQINAIAKVQGVIECAPDGEIINANDIFLKLLGYTLDEVQGQELLDVRRRRREGHSELPGILAGADSAARASRVSTARWRATATTSGCRAYSIRSSTPTASRSRSSPISTTSRASARKRC